MGGKALQHPSAWSSFAGGQERSTRSSVAPRPNGYEVDHEQISISLSHRRSAQRRVAGNRADCGIHHPGALLAGGLAGDEQGAARLMELLNDKNERLWIRCEAMKSISKSVPRTEAVRVLQIYSQDETPGPDPRHYPLQSIARTEMRRISEAEPK